MKASIYNRQYRGTDRPERSVPRVTTRDVVEFAKAQLGGNVDDATLARRLDACRRCDRREGGDPVEGAYCNACVCPKWRFAKLGKKARKRLAPCPPGRWPKPD